MSVEFCAGVSDNEEGGLDLLASLLDSDEEEDETVPQPDHSSGRKRKGEEVGGERGKRRKVGSSGGGSGELAVEDRMAQMSGTEQLPALCVHHNWHLHCCPTLTRTQS